MEDGFHAYLRKIIKQCEYDSNGNLIHRAYLCGKEEWFDSNGNLIHSKDEFGLEHWREYDMNGNLVHDKSNMGDEEWYENEYDSNDKLIHRKNNKDCETWYEYDSNGNLLKEHKKGAGESWRDYDSNGKLIHEKVTNKVSDASNDWEGWYEYDSKGNLIHVKVDVFYKKEDLETNEYWYEYDSRSNLIHEKSKTDSYENNECTETRYSERLLEYDSNGNLIHAKDSNGIEFFGQYNSDGQLTYVKGNGWGYEKFYEESIEYNSNGKVIHVKESIANFWSGKIRNHEVEYDSDGNVIHEEWYDTNVSVLKKVSTANEINASYKHEDKPQKEELEMAGMYERICEKRTKRLESKLKRLEEKKEALSRKKAQLDDELDSIKKGNAELAKKIAEYYLAGVLIFAAIVFLAVFLIRKIPKHASSARQGDYGILELSVDEKKNPVDLQSGVSYNTILTSDQIIEAYDKAKDYFFVRRDNEAQVEINRILNSNAKDKIRDRARTLMDYLDEPTFDTLSKNFSYDEVKADPMLYQNCWVIWGGRVTNVRTNDSFYECDLLVGYENWKRLEGVVSLSMQQPVSIDEERPVQVLAKIEIRDNKVLLVGKYYTQL